MKVLLTWCIHIFCVETIRKTDKKLSSDIEVALVILCVDLIMCDVNKQ